MQYLKISGAILVYTGFLLILLIAAASAVSCEDPSFSGMKPGILFPHTIQAIEEEVSNTLENADVEISALGNIPGSERNENNTLVRLDDILTQLDQHLLKYQVLTGLYPDSDLQEAAMKAAEDRAEYIQNVSGREKLYQYIKDTYPESEYGHWLYAQEIRFFKHGGTGLSTQDKTARITKYKELESLQNQYVKNIRDDRPLTENLQIVERSASLRNEIATLQGFETWIDLKADEQGRTMNVSDISARFESVTPQVREMIAPIIADVLAWKRMGDPSAGMVYDYDIELYLQTIKSQNPVYQQKLPAQPAEVTINRSLSIISCLLGVRTEHIPDTSAYAPNVPLFRVFESETNATLGWFYLDLEKREGKISEWMTALISGSVDDCDNTSFMTPAPVFIVSGTLHETSDGTEFREEDLTLFFHELGHLYTSILIRADHSSSIPHILPVELTEASSQLFEYLAQTPEFLALLSTPKKCHLSLGEKENESSPYLFDPYSPEHRWDLARNTIIGLLDNRIANSPGNISFTEWYTEIYSDITGAGATNQGGYLLEHPHLSGSTAGMYWIYPFGDLYAKALYSRFLEAGVLNKTVWSEFIGTVLIPEDSSLPSDERVRIFCGLDKNTKWTDERFGYAENIRQGWQYIPTCMDVDIPLFI